MFYNFAHKWPQDYKLAIAICWCKVFEDIMFYNPFVKYANMEGVRGDSHIAIAN